MGACGWMCLLHRFSNTYCLLLLSLLVLLFIFFIYECIPDIDHIHMAADEMTNNENL